MAEVVIYGGELGGVAAALAASRRARTDTRVTLVFPEGLPGGQATVGGRCAWELRQWQHGLTRALPQGGSLARWLPKTGVVYTPGEFAALLSDELAAAGVHVLAGHEIEAVLPRSAPGRGRARSRKLKGPMPEIGSLRVRPLGSDAHGPILAGEPLDLTGDVFVDASATGRLTRLCGVPYSIGRADWNADERQMAASLLFAVEGVDWEALVAATDGQERPIWGTTVEENPRGGRRTFWGAAALAATDAVLAAFATAHPGFRVAGPRGWEEERGAFWLACLLVYNVDARRRRYDGGTEREVAPVPLKARDLDAAHAEAVALATSSDMLGALRRFPGLGGVRLATVGTTPRVASTLLVRESIHAMGPGPEPFAIRVEDVTGAGTGPADGRDSRHWARRVGLGFYWSENSGYSPGEVQRTVAATANPTYIPLDALLAPPVQNLLIAGHAARIESRAWWAMRAAPNLCVLGDAAGTAAALALHEGMPCSRFGTAEVAALQSWLSTDGALLDKW